MAISPNGNLDFPRNPAECSALSLFRHRYGRRYRRRGRRLPIIMDRTRRIYLEQIKHIPGPLADSDTLLVAAQGGVIVGLIGLSATMVVALSPCS